MENLISAVSEPCAAIASEDIIFSKIQQAKAVVTCIMFATEFIQDDIVLDRNTIYNALWTVDERLEELEKILCK